MRIKTARLPSVEELIELDGDYLVSPDAKRLRPGLLLGRMRGESVLVKIWGKTGTASDADIGALWRREMRLAERIRARPQAEDLLVPLLESGEARNAFFLVMPGEWVPLAARRRRVGAAHWLRQLSRPQQRRLLWANIARLAAALDIIHAQRIVHGDVGEWSVYTASDHEADFRIGGFEWCVRVGEPTQGPRQGGQVYAPVEDWRRLGVLATDLLAASAGGETTALDSARLGLSAEEQGLLGGLVQSAGLHFDRRRLKEDLEAVERDLSRDGSGTDGRYVLGARLRRTRLSRAISEATEGLVGADDAAGQRQFIAQDLAIGGGVVQIEGGVWALGECLAYRLLKGGGEAAPWRGCLCEEARPRARLSLGQAEPELLPSHMVEVVPGDAVAERIGSLGGRAWDWSELLGESGRDAEPEEDVRLGLLLSEVVLALAGAAQVIPVEVVGRKKGTVLLKAGSDDRLDRVRQALNAKASHVQLRDIFELEAGEADGSWLLSERMVLGRWRESQGSLLFSHMEERGSERVYVFSGTAVGMTKDCGFLVPAGDKRPQGIVDQRLRVLGALSTQKELLRTLGAPESAELPGRRRPLVKDRVFEGLDPSKRTALETIWRRIPLQAVVGPPGVGKTYLLGDYVRRLLEDGEDRSILVSSQGHQALNNAGEDICSALQGIEDVLIVRSRDERERGDKRLYPRAHAQRTLSEVMQTAMFERAPPEIRRAVRDLHSVAAGQRVGQRAAEQRRELGVVEAVVMQAADVLLSTTNSGDLAQLVAAGANFDEVIVEEAAKATGAELAAPLLLSMQRLLIGDHRQLPAFDSDALMALLADVGKVRALLDDMEPMLGGSFQTFGLEELQDVAGDEAWLTRVCRRAAESVRLFETLVRRDRERQARLPGARAVSVRLHEQRRMHPVICDVVSRAFYADELEHGLQTSVVALQKFASGPPPFVYVGEDLPLSPLLWIDLPYVRAERGGEERAPAHHNPAERAAVMAVLERVRPRDAASQPDLAVLSPYRQQAEKLGLDIAQGRGQRLAHLNEFGFAAQAGAYAGTVDSFQGSEADLVIVSLVRNNMFSGARALGFLDDARRMNVLLSRAKWQLVLVGSWEFLRTQSRRYGKSGRSAPSRQGCMTVLIEILEELLAQRQEDGSAKMTMIPAARLVGGAA